jgi:Transposase DDE domain group 1
MTECIPPLPDDFYQQRQLVVRYSNLELSSDAGILLARQAAAPEQIYRGLADGIDEWRYQNKIVHSLHQLVSQRVYQLIGGYEDANDSNVLRHGGFLCLFDANCPFLKPIFMI